MDSVLMQGGVGNGIGDVGDWEWVADSGAAIPAVGRENDQRIIEIFWDRSVPVRGCGGITTAWLCILVTPFSEAEGLGVYSPGSLQLYPMKRIADNGYVAFDQDGFKIWKYSEDANCAEIQTRIVSDIPIIVSEQEKHSKYVDMHEICRQFFRINTYRICEHLKLVKIRHRFLLKFVEDFPA